MTVIRYKTLSEQLYADSDYLTKLANKPSMREHCQEIINATVDINRAAFKLAHPEEKTGHWEYVQYDYNPNIGNWHCSECRNIVMRCANKNEEGGIPIYNYCPNCGEDMRGD